MMDWCFEATGDTALLVPLNEYRNFLTYCLRADKLPGLKQAEFYARSVPIYLHRIELQKVANQDEKSYEVHGLHPPTASFHEDPKSFVFSLAGGIIRNNPDWLLPYPLHLG